MRYLLILTLWIAIYYVPMLIPDLNSTLFYTNQILASMLLVFGLNWVDNRYPGQLISVLMVICLIFLTALFALFNLLTQIAFLNGNYLLHGLYSPVSDGINALEVLVLLIWLTIGLIQYGLDHRMGVFGSLRDLFHESVLVNISEDKEWKG